MNDRYLHKAKTKCIVDTYNFGKEDGEWVKGYLYCDTGKWVIKQFEYDRADYVCYEIDPSTICQCTGLPDKNGKKIWENDIVRLHQFLFDGSEYEKEILISIEYITEMLCFGANLIEAKEIKRYMGYEDEDIEKVVIPFNDFYGLHDESFEVIGNIFDNPELLEGGTE
jgi:uncharacterized phage protein (TIGR01671 family)